ncbi:putative PurR-regulated permease PerM [Isoptericola jiangsuensis]|uniref:Putative PurR-regulated permease PerM n=1 Tax=Isoptericola jiangsuensis TaxID=548579 RepID=A0A2A9F238_9MICO|nr:AI-2E family transporter [Isoptericola jiangsuensis]PFG44602.1 putative PurR-regulated permease PerM [Isoptericola jiangsuensis]
MTTADPRRPAIERWGRRAWAFVGIALAAVVVYLGTAQISGLVVPLVVALVVGALFAPACQWLARWMPRPLAALVVLVALLGVAVGTVAIAVRGVVAQAPEIGAQLSDGFAAAQGWLDDLGVDLDVDVATDGLPEWGSTLLAGVTAQLGDVFSGTAALLMGLFVGVFLLYFVLADWDQLMGWTSRHLGVAPDVGAGIVDDGTWAMRRYFLALTASSLVVSAIVGVAAWALGLPLAFPIAVVTMVTSYVPFLGAIVSGAFAVLIALGSGGMADALIMLAVILVAQNAVQTVIQTFMTQGALRLHPIVILGSTIAGAATFGLLGAALSTPVVAIVIKVVERLRAVDPAPTPAVAGADDAADA